jgi:tetratricopeptide (TPR) repeat protein
MPALPKPPLPDGPIRTLFDGLHELHHRAGWPSLRDMSREVGCSHTTVSVAFSEPRVPRWGLLELIVETLGGDTENFHRLWLAASRAEQAPEEAAPSAVTVPRDLPADVVGFTARADQLAALDEMLGHSHASNAMPIVEICGTAGVGKTALAVHWAHRVIAKFPDGQLYLNLRGYDPDRPVQASAALEGFLRELGVADSAIPQDLDARAVKYRTLLAGRQVLVLLDNAYSVEQVRHLLPGSPSCCVVVTSRDSLPALVARHGARRINLDLLSPADAASLLGMLLGARVDAAPTEARALAERCVRLPLALRIAGELATARPGATLAELVDELGDEARRLDLLSAGEDEYTAVRAVFSWSLRQLDADPARAFRLLALHPGEELDVHAAAALFGTDLPSGRRLLDTLVRAHVLDVRNRGRFSMHDLLRAYAAERVAEYLETDREQAIGRLADYYLINAQNASQAPAGNGWLDAERANLIAVAAVGSPAHTLGIATTLAHYLDARAYYAEALSLDELALAAARRSGNRAGEATVLNLLGGVHRRLGGYRTAAESHQRALTIHRQLGDRAGEGLALHGLGTLSWRTGHYPQARDQLARALTIFAELGDRTSEGHSLYALGTVYLKLGCHTEAVTHLERALTIIRDLGDRTGEGRALNNLGEVWLRLGRVDEAAEHYRRSLTIAGEVGNRTGEAVAMTNLASIDARVGRFDAALDGYNRAQGICREVGYRIGQAEALHGIGVVHRRLGEYDVAIEHLQRAVVLGRAVGEPDVETVALNELGDALREAGRMAESAASYRSALERSEKTGDRYEQARAHDGIAELMQAQHDEVGALDHWNQALALYADLGVTEADKIRARLA